MRALHRTPVHVQALRMVRDGQVGWRLADPRAKGQPVLCRPAGFTRHNGGHLEPKLLVALWELRQTDLIRVDGRTVTLTDDGQVRFGEWSPAREAS